LASVYFKPIIPSQNNEISNKANPKILVSFSSLCFPANRLKITIPLVIMKPDTYYELEYFFPVAKTIETSKIDKILDDFIRA